MRISPQFRIWSASTSVHVFWCMDFGVPFSTTSPEVFSRHARDLNPWIRIICCSQATQEMPRDEALPSSPYGGTFGRTPRAQLFLFATNKQVASNATTCV